MAYSSSPPRDGAHSMLLIFLMVAAVYSLDPLLHSSSSPRGGARVTLLFFLNHDIS